MKKTIIAVLAAAAALLLLVSQAFADGDCTRCGKRSGEDLRIIKRNLTAYEISGLNPGETYNQAMGCINSMEEDGSWADVDYDTVPAGTFPAVTHIDRLRTIARAYCLPNQPLYENDEAIRAIEKALPAVETKVLKMTGGIRQTPGNWWWWNLNIPAKLGFVLLCAENKIDEEIFSESVESVRWCLEHPLNWYMSGLSGQATNSIDSIRGNLIYSVLIKSDENLKIISDEFNSNFVYVQSPFEGLFNDDSFIAHNMLDFYGYFGSMITGSIQILSLMDETAYMPSEEILDNFAKCLCEGAVWSVYQGYRDVGLAGRTMLGPFTKTQTAQIKLGLKYFAEREGNYRQKAGQLLDKLNSGYEAVSGHKYFYNGEFTVHKDSDSYVSVRTSSSRRTGAESWGGNGIVNKYMGDGLMWIFNDASEFYDSNMFACLDWNRLAGTTVANGLEPYKFLSYYHTAEPFVGGVSNGENGISAMNLSQISFPLSAQKSWFFFDDEIVCMGSGIESDSENQVDTVIDQRPDNGGRIVIDSMITSTSEFKDRRYSDVSWISGDNVGYYFPEGTDVCLTRETRKGSWSAINASLSSDPLYQKISSLYINHGKNVKDESYAYAVLPDATAAETEKYASSGNIEIIENSKDIHAVRDISSKSTGIVFWPDNREFLSVNPAPAQSYYDGIYPRAIGSTNTKIITVRVKGKTGAVNGDESYGLMGYAVSEQRLKGDVDMEVCWFDAADAPTGANWYVSYLTDSGVKSTEVVPYRYTDEWVTTTLKLKDASFAGTGLVQDGVELAIIHSNAPVDTTKEKYEFVPDIYTSSIATSSTLRGVVVNSIKLSPSGKTANESYLKTADIITVNYPMIVYYKETEQGITLWASDPRQKNESVELTVDGKYTVPEGSPSVKAQIENGKTKLSFASGKGESIEIQLRKAE